MTPLIKSDAQICGPRGKRSWILAGQEQRPGPSAGRWKGGRLAEGIRGEVGAGRMENGMR